jgi:hypothetical protein
VEATIERGLKNLPEALSGDPHPYKKINNGSELGDLSGSGRAGVRELDQGPFRVLLGY